MDLIFGALNFFSTGNRAMYSGTNLTPYEMQKNLHGVMRLGGGGLDYLPVCSEDHSASMLRWDGLCSQKRTYTGGGGIGSQEFIFFNTLFSILRLRHLLQGQSGRHLFPVFKKLPFQFGRLFFFSDLENIHFQFLCCFWFF